MPQRTLTGASTEAAKTATTSDTTVVLLADFYRAGDGIDESFRAQMIVSDTDLAPDIRGSRTSGSRVSAAARRS
jgi:hypothetical protein